MRKNTRLWEEAKPFQANPIEVKIAQDEDSRWNAYLQTINGEEGLFPIGYETKEQAEHAAMTKGYWFDKNTSSKAYQYDRPKLTKHEPVKFDKPTEMKLEQYIRRLVKEERRKLRLSETSYPSRKSVLGPIIGDTAFHMVKSGQIDYKDGKWYVTDKYKGAVNNSGGMYLTNEDAQEIVNILNKRTETPESVYKRQARQSKKRIIPYSQWFKNNVNEKVESTLTKEFKLRLSEAPKITKEIEAKLREAKQLQEEIDAAQAQIEKIIEETGMKAKEKRLNQLLRDDLWDFFDELKSVKQRLVELEDIIVTINTFQSEVQTFQYEKGFFFLLEKVNQATKGIALDMIKLTEKISKRKGSYSFKSKTEAVGDSFWDKLTNFFSKFLPSIKKKGEQVDKDIDKLKSMLDDMTNK